MTYFISFYFNLLEKLNHPGNVLGDYRLSLLRQFQQLILGQFGAHIFAIQQRVSQRFLRFVQLDDLLFDRSFSDKPVNGDGILLPDAVSAVGSLLLNGGFSPRVEMNDIIGCREVQTQSSSLQTDKEERHIAGLKPFDKLGALLGRCSPVEVEIVDSFLVERFADEREMRGKLAEDQGTVVIVMERVDHLQERSLFGRRDLQFLVDKLRVAGSLSQPRKLGERLQRCGLAVGEVEQRLLADMVVERPFLLGELDLACHLRLLRQLVEHIVLRATKDEGGYHASQDLLRTFVVQLLDRCDEPVGELLKGA